VCTISIAVRRFRARPETVELLEIGSRVASPTFVSLELPGANEPAGVLSVCTGCTSQPETSLCTT
jgi:hypothetical protein